MKDYSIGKTIGRTVGFFVIMSVICGVLIYGRVLGDRAAYFPYHADGSIIEVDADGDGVNDSRYCMLLGQQFEDDDHLWGRPTNYNLSTFTDDEGNPIAWAVLLT